MPNIMQRSVEIFRYSKEAISTKKMAEILSRSRILRSPLDEKDSQCKAITFEKSEISARTVPPSMSWNRTYSADYEPSKQPQREAQSWFLIPHSAKYLAGNFWVVL